MRQLRIAAWPEPGNHFFDDAAGNNIGKRSGENGEYDPAQSFLPEIAPGQHEHEKVEWDPDNGFSHVWEKRIEEAVVPFPVQQMK